MTAADQYLALRYLRERRDEQRTDNANFNTTLTCRGIDYHVYRKKIAAYLFTQIFRHSELSDINVFTDEGLAFYRAVLAAGVWRQTIRMWLRKYHGMVGELHAVSVTLEVV
jgi:hypothetical protein